MENDRTFKSTLIIDIPYLHSLLRKNMDQNLQGLRIVRELFIENYKFLPFANILSFLGNKTIPKETIDQFIPKDTEINIKIDLNPFDGRLNTKNFTLGESKKFKLEDKTEILPLFYSQL